MTKKMLYLITMPFFLVFFQSCGELQSNNEQSGSVNYIGTFQSAEFYDTGENNSLSEKDNLFSFETFQEKTVLKTDSTLTNIHSHIIDGNSYESFVFSGKMMYTHENSGIGFTFLSQYPNRDAYYRVRRYANQSTFHIANHGHNSTCKGKSFELDTRPGNWISFRVTTDVQEDSTAFQIELWNTNEGETSLVKLECIDTSDKRFSSGTVGVWSMGPGTKYWTDFRLTQDLFGTYDDLDSPTSTPDPEPEITPEPETTPEPEPIPEPEPTPEPPTTGNTISVNGITELKSTIASAKGGELILLEPGSYGALTIRDRAFSSKIVIRSKNGTLGAKFGAIKMYNSSNIRIDSVEANGGREAILVDDGSYNIDVVNSHLRGGSRYDRNKPDYTQVNTNYSIQVRSGSHHVLIENNLHTDVINGPSLFGASDITIRNNKCDWVRADCYKMAGIDGLLFEGNSGAKNIYAAPGAHADFFQAQGIVKNAILRNNIYLMGTRSTQGIFFGSSQPHENILVENNIIHTGHIRAISFNSYSKNITVRNNTVINSPGLVHSSSAIIGATTKENNIEGKSGTKGTGFNGSNYMMQHSSISSTHHYSDVYQNIMKRAIELEDLRPVPGGPGDCGSGMGAEKLICGKLGL